MIKLIMNTIKVFIKQVGLLFKKYSIHDAFF